MLILYFKQETHCMWLDISREFEITGVRDNESKVLNCQKNDQFNPKTLNNAHKYTLHALT